MTTFNIGDDVITTETAPVGLRGLRGKLSAVTAGVATIRVFVDYKVTGRRWTGSFSAGGGRYEAITRPVEVPVASLVLFADRVIPDNDGAVPF